MAKKIRTGTCALPFQAGMIQTASTTERQLAYLYKANLLPSILTGNGS